MASGGAARKNRHDGGDEPVEEMGTRLSRRRSRRADANPIELDRVIHERVRLAIVSALAGSSVLSFTELKAVLETSDGNLSVHARRLEEAGYITCRKTFDGRVPRTEYSLTREGRRALQSYLEHMEALIRRVREP